MTEVEFDVYSTESVLYKCFRLKFTPPLKVHIVRDLNYRIDDVVTRCRIVVRSELEGGR